MPFQKELIKPSLPADNMTVFTRKITTGPQNAPRAQATPARSLVGQACPLPFPSLSKATLGSSGGTVSSLFLSRTLTYTLTRDSHWYTHRHILLPHAHMHTHTHHPHTCMLHPHAHSCTRPHTHAHSCTRTLPSSLTSPWPPLLVVLPGTHSCHQFVCWSTFCDCHCHPRSEGCSCHFISLIPPFPQHPAPSMVPSL